MWQKLTIKEGLIQSIKVLYKRSESAILKPTGRWLSEYIGWPSVSPAAFTFQHLLGENHLRTLQDYLICPSISERLMCNLHFADSIDMMAATTNCKTFLIDWWKQCECIWNGDQHWQKHNCHCWLGYTWRPVPKMKLPVIFTTSTGLYRLMFRGTSCGQISLLSCWRSLYSCWKCFLVCCASPHEHSVGNSRFATRGRLHKSLIVPYYFMDVWCRLYLLMQIKE